MFALLVIFLLTVAHAQTLVRADPPAPRGLSVSRWRSAAPPPEGTFQMRCGYEASEGFPDASGGAKTHPDFTGPLEQTGGATGNGAYHYVGNVQDDGVYNYRLYNHAEVYRAVVVDPLDAANQCTYFRCSFPGDDSWKARQQLCVSDKTVGNAWALSNVHRTGQPLGEDGGWYVGFRVYFPYGYDYADWNAATNNGWINLTQFHSGPGWPNVLSFLLGPKYPPGQFGTGKLHWVTAPGTTPGSGNLTESLNIGEWNTFQVWFYAGTKDNEDGQWKCWINGVLAGGKTNQNLHANWNITETQFYFNIYGRSIRNPGWVATGDGTNQVIEIYMDDFSSSDLPIPF